MSNTVLQKALDALPSINLTVTENGAAAFKTTGNACLDFFFSLIRNTSIETLTSMLYSAWNEDRLTTVKILLHCRDCREGKGERLIVLQCLIMLRRYKTRTYLKNLQAFVKVGYYQDLLNLAKLAEEDGQPILGEFDMVELEVLAEQLRADEANLETKSGPVSLAAKWAPTECHSDDCKYEFSSRLAILLYPDLVNNGKSVNGSVMKQYRMLLTKLRNHLRIVESQMAHNKWSEIEYQHVPAKAHKIHTSAFKRHDLERYEQYLANVQARKMTIKSTGLQPHELIKPLLHGNSTENLKTIKCQWKDLIEKLKQHGSLGNVLPLCDVSSSMEGLPMDVCIAMGLVVSELSADPFRNMIMTFESKPRLIGLQKTELEERVRELKRLQWGGSTNLTLAFDTILSYAKIMQCPQDRLPRVLIIFSDMQFDQACPDTNKNPTVYQDAKSKFEAAGYKLPSVVFWNLRGDTKNSFPVTINEEGVALLSGYSAQLLKLLMEDPEHIHPIGILHKALESYQDVVIDEEDQGVFETPNNQQNEKVSYVHVSKKRKPRGKGPGSARRKGTKDKTNDTGSASCSDTDI